MLGSYGKHARLARLLAGPEGRAACLAFDHGLHVGPIAGAERPAEVIAAAVAAELDGIILAPGLAMAHAEMLAGRDRPSLILRLDQTTMWRLGVKGGYETGYTRRIATVEEAVQLGADAVLCYLFTSHTDPELEMQSAAIAAEAARDARRFGVPLIIEPMAARNGLVDDICDADVIAANCRMAMEIGADVVKTDWSGDAASFRKVVDTVGVPVLVAGGPRDGTDAATLRTIGEILEAGGKGILFGRHLFQASDPAGTMRKARDMIHGIGVKARAAPRRTRARRTK